jgi:8-oxo-dGTP diphosphatase
MLKLPFTICFCLCGDQVLMLHRKKNPNANLWNGLGGKIEAGETPLQNIYREIQEEAHIDLHLAQELRFTGLVTWDEGKRKSTTRGMYVYVAQLPTDFPLTHARSIPEGMVAWKPLAWVCDPTNQTVVSNIPIFLPQMLTQSEPQEFSFFYHAGILLASTTFPIAGDYQEIDISGTSVDFSA